MKNGQRIMLGALSIILIFLFSIVGCSDSSPTGSLTSYTGSMLTAVDVDDYSTSIRGGNYCIHKDGKSSCIDLVSLLNDKVDTKGPTIHIYPERTVYLFYHEGNPIVRIERKGDTTDLIDTLGDPDRDPPDRNPSTPNNDGTGGNNDNNNDGGGDADNDRDGDGTRDNGDNTDNDDNNNGDADNDNNDRDGDGTRDDDDNTDNDNNNNGDADNDNNDRDTTPADTDDNGNTPENTDPTENTRDGHGWLIWIYYPEGTAPINPPTLSASNVTVTINGKRLTDADITGFAQFIGSEGERGIQFFYPTESAELLDLKVQMIGITDEDGNVRFNINYLWRSY